MPRFMMRRPHRRMRRRYGRMHQLQLPFGKTVTDVLGETRVADKVWPDGSYNCPFCWSAAPPQGCQNPACSAGAWALSHPEQTRPRYEEARRQSEARKAEEARRQRDREWGEQYRAEQARERALAQATIEREAHKRGACVRCALENFPYRAPKYIKHRGKCPKER